MSQDDKSTAQRTSRAESVPQSPEEVDQFFTKLQSDMRRPDLSQDAITEAFDSIQRLAQEGEPVRAGDAVFCPSCRRPNGSGNKFCSFCGSSLQAQPAEPAPGRHHYHHHYHHHEFSAGAPGMAQFVAPNAAPVRDVPRARTAGAATGQPMGRAEVSLRKVSQDWAFSCNTKHLDDMVALYATDAMVVRSNVPPVRGTAAIRELFFAALDAGLGEVEFEPLRVELFGDVGYEVGRCKMLVPSTSGKRREERGKYLIISHRQEGEWKIVADSWSTDLSLNPMPDANAKPNPAAAVPPRPTRK
jgi:ketosteroid isomerase-like protein